jgi:hypothetical protein
MGGIDPNGRLRSEQISFFLGRKTLLTFQECRSSVFANILPRLQSKDSRLRRNDASFLLYSLLDVSIDHYFPILEEISERLEDLEEAVLGKGAPSLFEEIHRFRGDLAMLRRIAWPMRELVNNLTRQQYDCLSDTTKTYLRDVYDHVVQLLELIETYREFGSTLTETHMSVTSNRMNDIVKTLSGLELQATASQHAANSACVPGDWNSARGRHGGCSTCWQRRRPAGPERSTRVRETGGCARCPLARPAARICPLAVRTSGLRLPEAEPRDTRRPDCGGTHSAWSAGRSWPWKKPLLRSIPGRLPDNRPPRSELVRHAGAIRTAARPAAAGCRHPTAPSHCPRPPCQA